MVAIRKITIKNYRSLESFEMLPTPGLNCLIGPGDSGKSSIIDAIEKCLSPRRSLTFSDADFSNLDVQHPIVIDVTLGDLDSYLLSIESYGPFLRSFDANSGDIEDEPDKDGEPVLTVRLRVDKDLEPVWSLYSLRAEEEGREGNLRWDDRRRISAVRIGSSADFHLAWRRGSVFSTLPTGEADISQALADAARNARTSFGDNANEQLSEALQLVAKTAGDLGVSIGEMPQALLDPDAVTFGSGAVTLHTADGIPLRLLGLGSLRLIIAGLQRSSTQASAVLLVDEVEQGLEPHRIISLLNVLGAKTEDANSQTFITTHSPVVIRELHSRHLHVVRRSGTVHEVKSLGLESPVQGQLRLTPEAFLAKSVLVCEGATEVGFVRGLDLYRTAQGNRSLGARGAALVDAGGISKVYGCASAFRSLGYRCAVLRDDDVPPPEGVEIAFHGAGGSTFSWGSGLAIEGAIFRGVGAQGAIELVDLAVELHGENLVESHLASVSDGELTIEAVKKEISEGILTDVLVLLTKASTAKHNAWFKRVGWMEEAARRIIGPRLNEAQPEFRAQVDSLYQWIQQG